MARDHDIEGGTATFREKHERNAKANRLIAIAARHIPNDADPGVKVKRDVMGFAVDWSDDDIDRVWAFNDLLILTDLKAWSLDQPLPTTRDELELLPQPLYLSLLKAAGDNQRNGDEPVDEFGPDAHEDPHSPTEA